MTATALERHAPVALPRDAHFGDAAPGKLGMWIFLVSDGFSFAGLLLALGILRGGHPEWVPAGEPAFGVPFTAALTFLLVASSFTNVLAWSAAAEGRRRAAAVFLAVTALAGVVFLTGQYHEWFGIAGPGLVDEGLHFGASARASLFFVITGFHGLHVIVGVLYILTVLARWLRGTATAHDVEVLGLYWCFVDFVWVFVFSFVYLMPT